MSRRSVLFVNGAVLLAVFLLTAPQALAGEHVRAGHQTTRSQPVPVFVVRPAPSPVTISFAVPAAAPAVGDGAYISLRGPDGQLRRFAVEGGTEGLSSRVVVLRPGESLTIQLTANK